MSFTPSERRKGHYLGTEIDEKWYRRYTKDKMFARGNGEYWFDDTAFYFHRYLTKHPIRVPFEKVIQMKIGSSHSGRWVFKKRVLKLVWEKDDMKLSSGFLVARNQEETEALMAVLRRRISA
jgi:hypothetical protein